MNKKQILETAGIKAGDWKDNLNPFKPRPKFGSGHFAFAVLLTVAFFTFPGTVYSAKIITTSQSSQPDLKPGNQSNIKIEEPSTKAIDNYLKDSNKQLTDLEKAIKQIKENKTTLERLAVIIAAVITAAITLLVAWLNSKTQKKITKLENELTRDMLRDARLEEHVFNSLQWLSGGTQKRSIGIAVIDANWKNEKLSHLHETWTSVLVAQAVYLLAEQKRKKNKQRQHEITNANNILKILQKALNEKKLLINQQHVEELQRALDARKKQKEATKGNSKHDPELPEKSVELWQKLANEINRILAKTPTETKDKQVKELQRALNAIVVDNKHGLELPEGAEKRWEKLVYDAKAKLKKPQCWLKLFIS